MDPGSIPGKGKCCLQKNPDLFSMLSWSSGLGRHPLTVEIAGSTPAGSEYFSLWRIESLEVVRIIFGFLFFVRAIWIKISDSKRDLIMQIEARIILDKILDDILADEKIRDEIPMIQIQKLKLLM